jgi:hypothetical protein
MSPNNTPRNHPGPPRTTVKKQPDEKTLDQTVIRAVAQHRDVGLTDVEPLSQYINLEGLTRTFRIPQGKREKQNVTVSFETKEELVKVRSDHSVLVTPRQERS